MSTQELVVSSCSAAGPSSSSATRTQATPAIQLHDLATSGHVQAFKTVTCAPNTLSWCQSHDGVGGTVWAVQEGKAIISIWAWQKDQQHLKLHLPERLTCIALSPNGLWLAAGSPNGQIYLWEVASGLMLASWNAHYRAVTTLSFTNDSAMLLSSSADAAVHIFLVAQLVNCDATSPVGKPYGSLSDHTLGITAVALGKSTAEGSGRCWTASEDGTVKMWSLQAPFDLLATFTLPPSVSISSLVVDPAERFLYVASKQGDVYLIPLYNREPQTGQIEAVNGHGPSAPPVRIESACISVGTPITRLALSFSASQLLIGTSVGDIHVHALPSHQQVRTIPAHAGPVSYLATMTVPPDLVGRAGRAEDWPIMEIKNLERMRTAKSARELQEVSVLIRPDAGDRLSLFRGRGATTVEQSLGSVLTQETPSEENTAALREEIRRLQGALDKAVQINEKMWNGVVDLKLGSTS